MGDSCLLILWGVLAAHATRFVAGPQWPRFSLTLRAGVLFVLLLTTLSTMAALYDIWHYATLVNASMDDLLMGTTLESLEPLLVGLCAVCVQTIMALRVVQEGKWRWAYICSLGCLILFELLACVLTEYYQIKFHLAPASVPEFPISYAQAIEIWMLLEAAIDIVISVSALITTLLAIVTVLVYPGYDPLTEDIYFAFLLPQPALYALSLFATLSIAEKSRRHSRLANAYLVDIENPFDLPLPKFAGSDSVTETITVARPVRQAMVRAASDTTGLTGAEARRRSQGQMVPGW
ncbi:hypothetical protein RQP46_001068 [Phenoliferia psychrophenolica]